MEVMGTATTSINVTNPIQYDYLYPQATGYPIGGPWWGIYPPTPVEPPREVLHVFLPQPHIYDNSANLIELGYLRAENERLRNRVKELEEKRSEID